MIRQSINTGTNLTARLAAKFVSKASEFKSEILLTSDNKTINAKSIMGIYALGLRPAQDLTLTAAGEDEETAVSGLVDFFTKEEEQC